MIKTNRNTAGKIYQVGDHYGLALYHEQKKYQADGGKIFIHLFTDPDLTVRVICPKTGKNMVAIRTREQVRLIGFND